MTKTETPYRNVVNLSTKKVEELLKNLEKLKDYGGDLFDRAVRYVLDGEDEAVLAELAGKRDVASALSLLCEEQDRWRKDYCDWQLFFNPIEAIDYRFYLRLGKTFEAAASQLPANRFVCQSQFDNNRWLEILLQQGTGLPPLPYRTDRGKTTISWRLIKGMLTADGRSVEPFITAAFKDAGATSANGRVRSLVLGVENIGESFAEHPGLIVRFLLQGSASSRQAAVENISISRSLITLFINELVDCATETSKILRETAEPLLRAEPDLARSGLEKVALNSNASKRQNAVRLLGRMYGKEIKAFLEGLQTTEKSAAVLEMTVNCLKEIDRRAEVTRQVIDPPTHSPVELNPPVTSALRKSLQDLFDEYNAWSSQRNQIAASQSGRSQAAVFELLGAEKLESICRLLHEGGNMRGLLERSLDNFSWHVPKSALKAFLEHPDLHLVHAMRFLSMLDAHRSEQISWGVTQYIENLRRSHSHKFTLLELAEVMEHVGIPESALVEHILRSSYPVFNWEAEAVWPFFSKHVEAMKRAFDPGTGTNFERRWKQYEVHCTIRVISKFPQIPSSLIGILWDMAIGTNKADRHTAQKAVGKLPDLAQRLIQALTARSFETRAVVAEWMGRLGDKQYVKPLHAAAKAERHDVALDDILTSLEKLGEAIEPYLDRDKLLADAQKGLKKGTPPALEWFPWTQLPKVHWNDSGKLVPVETVTWLIVQNFKLKSPEAGPLLRRYCEMMRLTERAELGRFVLGAWLDQDLKRKYSDTEARAQARQQAPQRYQQLQQWAQHYVQQSQALPAYLQKTQQQVEEGNYQQLQREVGSASNEKGILAVAGACCDASAVGPVQKYLKEWYGYRAAQCKALIAMLASNDHPSAIQYLLSIANRFRTKGIREEAEKYVNLLAERKGWTLDELADRTLPTAGLDDDGTLALSFGPRVFHLRVNADLEAILTDGDGKTLKALPAPRKDDDEEQAKAAQKTFSAAKSEIKKFAGLQTTRLYEAMCTQRVWPRADWQTYLLGHPLMKFLCQRLVWMTGSGTKDQKTFRPLDDGTFTGVEDNEVQLPADAKIQLAHNCRVSAETAAAWVRHLADYEVAPLFTQFGRETYALPEERRQETEIADFAGHMVEAFKLRGLATKFGYTRGQAQDGSIASSSLTNNGALVYNLAGNQTYSGAIGGMGSLTKNGSGSLQLAGGNTYSGNTYVGGGTLQLGSNSALHRSSS